MIMEDNKLEIAVKRGRPNTPEGIETVTKNLKPQIKHGLYYFKNHPNRVAANCYICPLKLECEYGGTNSPDCPPVVEYQKQTIEDVSALPHIKPQDSYLVHLFAFNLAYISVIDRWLNKVGGNFFIEDNTIKVQPIIDSRDSAQRLVVKLADKLCLSPEARARVGAAIATYSIARALMNVKDDDD